MSCKSEPEQLTTCIFLFIFFFQFSYLYFPKATFVVLGQNILLHYGSQHKPVKPKIDLPTAAGVCLPEHTVFRRCFWIKPEVSKALARLWLQRCRALKSIITGKHQHQVCYYPHLIHQPNLGGWDYFFKSKDFKNICYRLNTQLDEAMSVLSVVSMGQKWLQLLCQFCKINFLGSLDF